MHDRQGVYQPESHDSIAEYRLFQFGASLYPAAPNLAITRAIRFGFKQLVDQRRGPFPKHDLSTRPECMRKPGTTSMTWTQVDRAQPLNVLSVTVSGRPIKAESGDLKTAVIVCLEVRQKSVVK